MKKSVNRFEIPGTENLSFTFSNLKDGYTQTLTVLQAGRETVADRKKEIDTSGINLTDYVGSYLSKELDVTYHFEMVEKVLVARIENQQQTSECAISDMDQFTMAFGLVRFQRKDSLISGFELDSGRVKNLKFYKK